MIKGYYKHINGRDMFIDVLASYDVNPEYIKIKFQCYNVGEFSQPWLMTSKVFKAKVMKKDLKNWRPYNVNP